MTNTRNARTDSVRKMVIMALFVALTYLANFICNFKLGFLSFEAKDAITVVCAYAYGPVAGIVVAFLSAVIESLSASATGIYGFVMNVAGSVTFVGISGLAYKFRKDISGAAIGVLASTITMTTVMLIMNIVLTPFYMGVPRSTVVELITPMLLPFNLVKGMFIGAVIMIIRYPILKAMQSAGALNEPVRKDKDVVRNIVLILSALLALFTIMYFVVVLGGRVELFE